MRHITPSVVAALLSCGTSAFAATSFGEHVQLSGFGTLGVASADQDAVDFVRDGSPTGAGNSASWKVDSKLGVQMDVTATDWLSGTVQVLTMQRTKPAVAAEFEWAFVKLKPLKGLDIRVGRTAPAMFMVSDTRNVGFGNTLIRQPNEVYSLASFKRLNGGDITYTTQVAGTTVTVQAAAGKSDLYSPSNPMPIDGIRGLNLQWDTSFGSFRIGQMKADVQVPARLTPTGKGLALAYTFTSVGYQWDDGNTVIAAELAERKTAAPFAFFDTKGWYVSAGHRFGSVLPYVLVAEGKAVDPVRNPTNGNQRTLALGARWDLVSNAALKVQYEMVDPKGTRGMSFSQVSNAPRVKTNVLSVAVDFIF